MLDKMNTYTVTTKHTRNGKEYHNNIGKVIEPDVKNESGCDFYLNLYMFPDTKFFIKKDLKNEKDN